MNYYRLLEAGASWEVSAFISQIYLPSSSGSSYPDVSSVIHFAINVNQKHDKRMNILNYFFVFNQFFLH